MLSRFLRFVLLSCVLAAAACAATPWPHEQSDLAPDPAVVWGQLDNGLRYAILPNALPAGRASLRLVVQAGSLHETPEESGYAHFVEHMAFNGTRRYPKETIWSVLQNFGMATGADVNAHTLMFTTFYKLEMPTGQTGRLAEGLSVLREFVDGMVFDADEVEREKGVIESERTARNTAGFRSGEAFRKFVFAGSLLGERPPIGTTEKIRAATPETLRAFYEKWYRADKLCVVVVGDFDVAEAERLVRAAFETMAMPATPAPEIVVTIPPNPPNYVAHFNNTGISRDAVSIQLVAVGPLDTADTRANRLRTAVQNTAFGAFDIRLQSARLRDSKKFGVMDVNLSNQPGFFQQALLRMDVNGRRWRDGVTRAEQELRRAQTYGFTAAEMKEITASTLTAFEHAVRTASTRTSAQLADHLMTTLMNQRVFTTPEVALEIVREALASATPESMLAEFRRAWGEGRPRIYADGSLPSGIGPAQLVKLAQESARKKVEPAKESAAGEFAYTNFGAPGAIAKRTHIADLDIHCVEFANGVKLNLKATDFETDSIQFSARFGTGQVGEPEKKPGLRMVMGHGFQAFGLGKHSRDQLNHLSAGVVASFGVGFEEESFVARGSSDATNADRWLQLLTASLIDPGWRKDQLPDVQKKMLFTLQQTQRNPDATLAVNRVSRLTGHDSRFKLPTYKQLEGYSIGDLRAWLEPQLKGGPLEVGIVGDFDVEEMIELAAATVGTLPKRGSLPRPRAINYTAVLKPTPLEVQATTRNGSVQVTWALPAAHDPVSLWRETMLGGVLRNRLTEQVREKMGATYSPQCRAIRSDFQRENGYLVATLTCDSNDTQRVAEAVRAIAAELATTGATDDELTRVRGPFLESVAAQQRTNGYWLGVAVAEAQSRPEGLDLPRNLVADVSSIKVSEINRLAAEVLLAERASLFTARAIEAVKK